MEVLIILLLIFLNGIFAMAEIAIVSARKSRLEAAAKRGDKGAKRAFEMAQHPGKLLSTVQVGITLIGLLTGIYSGEKIIVDVQAYISQISWLELYAEEVSTALVLVSITYVSLIFGELVPKRIGLTMPESIAKTLSRPMHWLSVMAAPFIWLLISTTDLFIRLFQIRKSADSHITEEEIKAIIREGAEAGTIQEIEQDIVKRVFHLGDRTVSSLMTHRKDIIWIDKSDTYDEWRTKISSNPFSMYPLCDGEPDKVRGIVHIRDILTDILSGNPTDLRKQAKPPLFFPESMKAYKALEVFKEEKAHFAVIVDEYGGMQGIITHNDLLDALIEDSSEEMVEDKDIIKRDDGSWLVNADISFIDLLNFLEIEPGSKKEVYSLNSLGGFIFYQARHIPVTGYHFDWEGYHFEVVDMDGRRVDKVLIMKL